MTHPNILYVRRNMDDSPSKGALIAGGYGEQPVHREELYDLISDPAEQGNLAERPECSAVLAEMRTRLQAWMERHRDPLLRGPVPPPTGGRFNRPDCLSPHDQDFVDM